MKYLIMSLFFSTLLVACDRSSSKTDTPTSEPKAVQTTPETKPAAVKTIDSAQEKPPVNITALEHGSLLLESNGIVVAIDPVQKALDANPGDEPKADIIVVTHHHGDHFDPKSIAVLRKPSTPVIVPQSVADKANGALPEPTVMANGDAQKFLSDKIQIEAVAMYNLKRKRPDNGEFFHPKGTGNGYIITLSGKRIYISGDTECTPEMKQLEAIDMAFVCMNLPYTMTPKEAAVCINAFKPKTLYPYHFRGQDPSELNELVDSSHTKIESLTWYR